MFGRTAPSGPRASTSGEERPARRALKDTAGTTLRILAWLPPFRLAWLVGLQHGRAGDMALPPTWRSWPQTCYPVGVGRIREAQSETFRNGQRSRINSRQRRPTNQSESGMTAKPPGNRRFEPSARRSLAQATVQGSSGSLLSAGYLFSPVIMDRLCLGFNDLIHRLPDAAEDAALAGPSPRLGRRKGGAPRAQLQYAAPRRVVVREPSPYASANGSTGTVRK